MGFSHFFVDRPIFAARAVGDHLHRRRAVAAARCRSASIPKSCRRPSSVRAAYPGANPQVIAETVAAPLEQAINGVENMLYMSSQATSDGADDAHGDVRARHRPRQRAGAGAEPRLAGAAEAARGHAAARRDDREGVARPHAGRAPDLARQPLRHALPRATTRRCTCATSSRASTASARSQLFGAGDYAMRVWLDPDKVAALQPDRGRRRARDPRAERAGRGRRSSARRPRRTRADFQLADQHAGPARRRGGVRATSSSKTGERRRRSRVCATSRASSSARATTRCARCSTTSPRSRCRSSRRPAPTRSRSRTTSRETMDELEEGLPAGRRLRDRLRPDDVRAPVDRRRRAHAVRGARCSSCSW